ncbi:MAG: alpha/beta hydrolase [Nannocystaceae bacterium]|nr:alpha/beta hydrolase [Nannocystaceae bacterium]
MDLTPSLLRTLSLLLCGLCGATSCVAPAVHGHTTKELLWPTGAPGAKGERRRDRPQLYYFAPNEAVRTDVAVVIAGGGSYGHQGGIRVEAIPAAKWLAARGISAIVVRYRVGKGGRYDHRHFLADGARALQRVRERADELGVDPHRIGMMGFSAGGHLAVSLAARCSTPADAEIPPIELPSDLPDTSCRPDFAVAIYPVVTLQPGVAHERSVSNLLPTQESREALEPTLSLEQVVSPTTAPVFLVHSSLDKKVDPRNSDLLHDALVEEGVKVEYLRPDDGGHGVGLAQSRRMPQMAQWPDAMLRWLESLGILGRA